MKEYRTDYSNHFHMLLVSVSKHLYILKNRTLKYQKKKMEYNLKNLKKAERELVVHYLITDHLSGVFYGEIHSSKNLIPIEEFLYRAWSKKEDFPFYGLPFLLSIPNTIKSEELLNLVYGLGIEPIAPTGGFMAGVKHLNIWENRVFQFDFAYEYRNNKQMTFEALQSSNIEICKNESQYESRVSGETKIELWRRGIKDLTRPPLKNVFFGFCKAQAEKEPNKYSPAKFEIFKTDGGEEYGEFVWGEERNEIIERYYDLSEELSFDGAKGMKTKIQALIKDDPGFLGSYELMGNLEYGKRNLKKAMKDLKKAVEIGDSLIGEEFSGVILNGEIDNRYFLRSLHLLGVCYLKSGKPSEALSCFNRHTEYSPSSYNNLKPIIADAYLHLGYYEKAKSIYSENHHDAHCAYCLGLLLFREGKFVESISVLMSAFAINPYIVELLTGNLELYRGQSFGYLLTEYGVACEYVEINLESWKITNNALIFLKSLYDHPRLNPYIIELSESLTQIAQEKDYDRKRSLEEIRGSVVSKIIANSSEVIWNDLSLK